MMGRPVNTASKYYRALGMGESPVYSQEELDEAIDSAVDAAYDSGVDFGFDAGYDANTTPAVYTSTSGSWWESILNPQTIQTAVGVKTAYDLNQINIERARRGQAPLPASIMNQLSPRVNVGLPQDQMTMLMLGGAALLLVLMARKN